MHYTIGNFEQIHGNLNVNFDITGNQYLVGLYNKETKEYTHKTFDTIEQALEIYNKLITIIIKGFYIEQDKRKVLKGEIE